MFHYRELFLFSALLLIFLQNKGSPIRTEDHKPQTNETCPVGSMQGFPPEKRCRQYQQCTVRPVPYITNPLETAQYLLSSNKSFIRFGDSELLLMRGGSEPFQKYDAELANMLVKAFKDQDDNLMIGLYDCFSGFPLYKRDSTDWWLSDQGLYRSWVLQHANLSRQYFSAMITSTYIHTYGTKCVLSNLLYQTLRKIWLGKDIVVLKGDNKQIFQYDVYDTAHSITTYIAPRYHAWTAHDKIKKELLKEDPRKLFILTCGPLARVLSYELAKLGRRALDLGHLAKDYDYFSRKIYPEGKVFFERNETPPDK